MRCLKGSVWVFVVGVTAGSALPLSHLPLHRGGGSFASEALAQGVIRGVHSAPPAGSAPVLVPPAPPPPPPAPSTPNGGSGGAFIRPALRSRGVWTAPYGFAPYVVGRGHFGVRGRGNVGGAYLELFIRPPAAHLRVDGQDLGSGWDEASRVAVSPGVHTVEVIASGFRTESRTVQVTSGATVQVSISLSTMPRDAAPYVSPSRSEDGPPSPRTTPSAKVLAMMERRAKAAAAPEPVAPSPAAVEPERSGPAPGIVEVVGMKKPGQLFVDDSAWGDMQAGVSVYLSLPPGVHKLRLVRGGQSLGETELKVESGGHVQHKFPVAD